MGLHSATKVLLWVILAVSIQFLGAFALAGASAGVLVLAVFGKARGLRRLLRRTRWLFLSLILIYGFASPGSTVAPSWGAWSPSWQGLQAGAMQAWRLALLLAGLSVLLATTPRNDLLQGLYVLLRPGRRLGLDVDRIALRTWLTLDYAERLSQLQNGRGWKGLQEALGRMPAGPARVTLVIGRFDWGDLLALAAAVALAGWLLQ